MSAVYTCRQVISPPENLYIPSLRSCLSHNTWLGVMCRAMRRVYLIFNGHYFIVIAIMQRRWQLDVPRPWRSFYYYYHYYYYYYCNYYLFVFFFFLKMFHFHYQRWPSTMTGQTGALSDCWRKAAIKERNYRVNRKYLIFRLLFPLMGTSSTVHTLRVRMI